MNGFAVILNLLVSLYMLLILARVLLSWIQLDTSNRAIAGFVNFVYTATEPVLRPIRNLLPPMPFDLSPMIVILGLSLLTRLI
ncbi:MAG: YggT family protein [Chloroflexota bacterium]|nr:YggT family protein [Chloroflexota bacterium]